MNRRSLAVLLLATAALGAGSAWADANELDNLILSTARLNQPVGSIVNGQRVRAVSLPWVTGRCARVGMIYLDSQGHGGPRVANFDVCGSDVHELGDVSPALPDDDAFRQAVQANMKAAALYGHRAMKRGGYYLQSARLTQGDANGCAIVDTTISSEGLLVANSTGRVCP